jgi:DNA-binding MarR family transcriptional regulator
MEVLVMESHDIIKEYINKYKAIVEEKYPKLSHTQKLAITKILIADSLTQEQMKRESIFSIFCMYPYAKKIDDDIILTHESSVTLKALAKKGLIEIVKDGKDRTDRIKLIKEVAE